MIMCNRRVTWRLVLASSILALLFGTLLTLLGVGIATLITNNPKLAWEVLIYICFWVGAGAVVMTVIWACNTIDKWKEGL